MQMIGPCRKIISLVYYAGSLDVPRDERFPGLGDWLLRFSMVKMVDLNFTEVSLWKHILPFVPQSPLFQSFSAALSWNLLGPMSMPRALLYPPEGLHQACDCYFRNRV
jgi:hypothetical protein